MEHPKNPQKVLVTGGAGYIGSLLCGELLFRGHRVIVIDNLTFGGNSLLGYMAHPHFAFHKADVCDRTSLEPCFAGVEVEYKDLHFDGDMRDIKVSFDKIAHVLGYKAQITVEEGIREMAEVIQSGFLTK